jgi:hypothetical protein
MAWFRLSLPSKTLLPKDFASKSLVQRTVVPTISESAEKVEVVMSLLMMTFTPELQNRDRQEAAATIGVQ